MIGNSSLTSILETRYNNSFSLLNAINDTLISENMEKFYVPQVENKGSLFIKKDESIAVTESGPKRIRFIYMDARGKNRTNPEASFIQINPECTGFLARLSVSRNFTSANLDLDYFIDISNIKYRVDTVLMAENSAIVSRDIIRFESINLLDYPKIEFDDQIRDFMLHKEELYDTYFK